MIDTLQMIGRLRQGCEAAYTAMNGGPIIGTARKLRIELLLNEVGVQVRAGSIENDATTSSVMIAWQSICNTMTNPLPDAVRELARIVSEEIAAVAPPAQSETVKGEATDAR